MTSTSFKMSTEQNGLVRENQDEQNKSPVFFGHFKNIIQKHLE